MKQITDIPIILIVPDIHGRLFWISATRKYPDLPVIFLGDYLDPYTYYEDILPSEALVNFKEILDFKKSNMDKVTLLLGNHDIHYFDKDMNSSRKDKEHYEEIHQIFSENLPLFKLAMAVRIEGRDFLFTHAGVGLGWLRYRMPKVNVNDVHDICKSLNDKLITEESLYDFVFNGLMDVSASRWAMHDTPHPYGQMRRITST